MRQYSVFFEGGLVVEADRHGIENETLIFYDEAGLEVMRIPLAAIDTYMINEEQRT